MLVLIAVEAVGCAGGGDEFEGESHFEGQNWKWYEKHNWQAYSVNSLAVPGNRNLFDYF